jgi:hypothetical protein
VKPKHGSPDLERDPNGMNRLGIPKGVER